MKNLASCSCRARLGFGHFRFFLLPSVSPLTIGIRVSVRVCKQSRFFSCSLAASPSNPPSPPLEDVAGKYSRNTQLLPFCILCGLEQIKSTEYNLTPRAAFHANLREFGRRVRDNNFTLPRLETQIDNLGGRIRMRVQHLIFKGAGGYLRQVQVPLAPIKILTDLNFYVHFHYKDAYLSLILGHLRLGIVMLIICRACHMPSSPDGM